tara:strand:- start:670 stop:951 length:282 start_codon:yes stop_codon:yes gene_type:complete
MGQTVRQRCAQGPWVPFSSDRFAAKRRQRPREAVEPRSAKKVLDGVVRARRLLAGAAAVAQGLARDAQLHNTLEHNRAKGFRTKMSESKEMGR